MQDKRPSNMPPLLLKALLWLCGVTLLFLIKDIVEEFSGPIGGTWVDLTLVLIAYLLFFILEPVHAAISRRLRKRARRRQSRHDTGTGI
ncbi:hypothetical protein [Pseudomonas fildesensis]|uniref:Uncharacterized protein n=1 Tax=Pseudomonas fildesensis TaxID=1674920 RepID=A0A0J8G109_9PSED|nr:hypothetical protein [Pseudomonas fildesensis]KMT54363.1 hypothetical protein ACR52_16140 [Pseudomonas fildesensis]